MKGRIDENGHALLELDATELRAMFCAVDREVRFHEDRVMTYTAAAELSEAMAAANRAGRVVERRRAGEARLAAAGHRSLVREAEDLRRVLGALTTDPAMR